MSSPGASADRADKATGEVASVNRWALLTLVAVAQLMVVLDVTIVNIALPSAQISLHFSTDDRQWLVTAYALSFGSLLLLGGKLGDLFGRKWTFFVGLLGFAGASAIGGLAPSFAVLVAARALQGCFGALLAPSALSLLTNTFRDSPDRPKAFGIFSAIATSGTSVGLLLGGLLTETLSWRWCLYVNLAFAIPAAIAALRLVPDTGPQRPRPRIDFAGVGLASSGFFCIVYGFSNAEIHTWSAVLTIAMFAAGALLLTSFLVVERRVSNPLLPLHIIANRSRGGAYACMAVVGAALFAVFLFMTYYMQSILHFSPLRAGLGFLPLTGAIVITAPLVQTKILPRIGPRRIIITGMVLGLIAMVDFTRLTPGGSYLTQVLPGLIPTGIGAACVFSSCFATATLGIKMTEAGVASAMVNTAQQIGGSIGVASLSTIFAGAVSHYIASHGHGARAVTDAQVHGYSVGFVAAAIIFAVGFVIAVALLPSQRIRQERITASIPSQEGVTAVELA